MSKELAVINRYDSSKLIAGCDFAQKDGGAISIIDTDTYEIVWCESFKSKRDYETRQKEIWELGIKMIQEK